MLVFWVHFVLAQAMCVSCALFLHKNNNIIEKKKKEMLSYKDNRYNNQEVFSPCYAFWNLRLP